MRIFKPTWVSHDGKPIFSVDIHPDGSRFATGGQGPDKCGRVIIWNMRPLLDENLEMKDDIPKILCQMDNHLACINCVRWSTKGKYLASAGDDKSLMIWQNSGRMYSNNQMIGQNNSSFAPANFEQWRCITTLHGHGGDILDLAWSPNDSYLASCSVDNLIIIWDALNFPQVITKITGHTGLVKGVSWDPIGKYLASQSDDKTVRIWRTNDWREEALIDEPFKECGGTTHVLRLGWSPDGQLLFSAHAMNNRGSTSQIIERDGWKAARDFVGHRKAITCVRPNPNIMATQNSDKKQLNQIVANNNTNGAKNSKQAPPSKTNKSIKYCCVAIGSRDRSLSIWLTNSTRPLTVAHDLFDSSILDISWSPEGYHLIACSQDGSIAVIVFKQEELGIMLTQEDKLLHHQKLYGKSMVANNCKKRLLVEDAELLKAQDDQRKRQKESHEPLNHNSHSNSVSQNGYDSLQCRSGLGENNNSLGGLSKGPTDKQIETLMPDGRRRITPLYIPPVINCDGSPLPFNANNSSITFSSSKESKTKIMIEVRDDSRSSNILPALSIEKSADVKLVRLDHLSTIEVENDFNSSKLTELRLLDQSNNKLWAVLLSTKASALMASENIVAVNCSDHTLNIFSTLSGRRLRPPLLLDSLVAHIAVESYHVLIITSNSNIWLWDFNLNKVVIRGETLRPLLTQPTQDKLAQRTTKSQQDTSNEIEILSCSLTESYKPLLMLSTGKSFLYDLDLNCWTLMNDSNDLIPKWSNQKSSISSIKRFLQSDSYCTKKAIIPDLKKSLPLASIQSQSTFDIRRYAQLLNKNNLQPKATSSFLDHQVVASLAINSAHEYHYWIIQSTQHFVDTGNEARLKELCSSLMDSTFGVDLQDDQTNRFILGLDKRDILRDVLSILATDLRYQRIYTEYKLQLDGISQSNFSTPK